jgi:hypothetical protein
LQDVGIGLKIGNINVNNTGCAEDIALLSTQEFNIRLYDKNSESDYFFFLHQNQNIFFSNTGNQNQVKWSFPKDTSLPGCHADFKTIGGAFYPFYAAFRIVVQALNNSPRFVLNSCMVHTPEQM